MAALTVMMQEFSVNQVSSNVPLYIFLNTATHVLFNLAICEDGALRLVGGRNDSEGRIEVCYRENWGTICDDGFDTFDASVICRQLGFSQYGEMRC